jgi:hypothetical protein
MTYAFDIPGYVQGHRFSDDPLYYDAAALRFKDLAGYGERADLRITAGTPLFETVNGQRCARLNNTFHGQMHSPIPWSGSCIVALKNQWLSGASVAAYPLIFGDGAVSSAGKLLVAHYSGVRRVQLGTGSDQLTIRAERTDNNPMVVAFAFDQQTRKAYMSVDGVTVTEVVGPASTVNGNAIALSSGQYGVRFGNISGTAGDLTEITNMTVSMYEQHFFDGNILTGSLAKTKEFVGRLKTQYGAI